jgi:hypothetical protein
MRGGTYARIGWCLRNTTMPFSNNKCSVSQIESTPVPKPVLYCRLGPSHSIPPHCLVNADPLHVAATSGPCVYPPPHSPMCFGRNGLYPCCRRRALLRTCQCAHASGRCGRSPPERSAGPGRRSSRRSAPRSTSAPSAVCCTSRLITGNAKEHCGRTVCAVHVIQPQTVTTT